MRMKQVGRIPVRHRKSLSFESLEPRLPLATIEGLMLVSDSGSIAQIGSGIQLTAVVDIHPNLEFSFRGRGSSSEWRTLREYSQDQTWLWQTDGANADRYFLTVFAREIGAVESYQAAAVPLSIILASVPPQNSLSIFSMGGSVLAIGTATQFHAQSDADQGGHEFIFLIRESTADWSVAREYQSSADWIWNTSSVEAGTYFITVYSHSVGSIADYELAATPVTITLHLPLDIGEIAVASSAGRAIIGSAIDLDVPVDAAGETLEIAFRMRSENSEWQEVREYSADFNWLFDTRGISPGIYYVGAFVRRSGNLSAYEALATPVTLMLSNLPQVSDVTLIADPTRRVIRGTDVNWTASTTESQLVEYAFSMRGERSDWSIVREYSRDANWVWNTSDVPIDVYYVTVLARKIGSGFAYEAIATPLTFVIADVIPATDVVFSMDWSTPARVGDPFEVSAWALGGSGDYEYRFRFRGELDWRVEQAHSAVNVWEWTPKPEQVGTQYIEVCARSNGSPVTCEATRVVRVDIRESIEQYWQGIYVDYLSEELWQESYAEDASHTLQLPLSAAFAQPDREHWRLQFSDQFERFMTSGDTIDVQLYRLEYYYLASRFVRLAAEANRLDLIPAGLVQLLNDEVRRLWIEEPAWMWDSPSFEGGIKERIEWKLNVESPPYRYYAAIVDHDLFLFGIAAELKAYFRVVDGSSTPLLDDVMKVARQVCEQRIVWNEIGGWLFQQGMWSDHPEYAHAGHPFVAPELPPRPVDNIAEDVSHSMRWPLWLKSLEAAADPGSSAEAYFHYLRVGLNRQFTERVLVHPSAEFAGYRVTNYMDGYNGIYRYQYYTAGANRGFNPFELSGALMIGMWGYLESSQVQDVYKHLAAMFPISSSNLATYVGANTQRVRHPLETWPAAFDNGNLEFHVLLAAELAITI